MKNISVTKYVLLLLAIGIAIGIVANLLSQMLISFSITLPSGLLGGAVTGAVMASSIFFINKSVKNGGLKWLQKKKTGAS